MSSPTSLAASISSIPFGAVSWRPLIVKLTVSVRCVIRDVLHTARGRISSGRGSLYLWERAGGEGALSADTPPSPARSSRPLPEGEANLLSPWLERTSPNGYVLLVFVAILFDRGDHGTGG